MAAFEYIALDESGTERKGVLEADSMRALRAQLRERGYAVLDVQPASATAHEPSNGRAGWLSARMSPLDLALVTRQLATLLRAALPLEEALRAVAQQSEKKSVRNIMLSVRSRVLEGLPLAAGLTEYPRAFPELYRATVSAGEQSGHLDQVLDNLADYTERRYQAFQNVQMAMVYPIILVVLAAAVVSGLMVYVVPEFVRIFEGARQELPVLTQILISMSDFMQSYWWLLLLIIVVMVVVGNYMHRQERFRKHWDAWVLRAPLFGRLGRGSNAAQFTGTLAILTRSGVPLVDAMRIAADVLSNRFLRGEVSQATRKVSEGSSLSAALSGPARFPPMMLHMIASGEASGELDTMLGRVADYQQSELERTVSTLVKLFEPLMLLVMGVTVLLIVLAILLPILGLQDLVQ